MTADSHAPDLVYPFYLDVDMSMAFAAALEGGVALEEEKVDRAAGTSEGVRSLGGSLRLWRAGGVEAKGEQRDRTDDATESRSIRRHTETSIFIALYNELRRAGLVLDDPSMEEVSVGSMVVASIGPAMAPLKRVLDQFIRLLDVMAPLAGLGTLNDESAHTPAPTRQQRRPDARQAAKTVLEKKEDGGLAYLQSVRSLFVALSDDLEASGMIDIFVNREDQPSVLLTLDRRFVEPPAMELLHTSEFRLIGKVTQVWRDEGVPVVLFRRSSLALVPSMAQSVAWAVFGLLGMMARAIRADDVQKTVVSALGGSVDEPPAARSDEDPGVGEVTSPTAANVDPGSEESAEPTPEPFADDFVIGQDVEALYALLSAPAFQVLPLALCS
jgi:hypothetical protein